MSEDNSPKRLAYEVKMMLSSVASHGPAALTTTHDPMYTANLLRRLRNALSDAVSAERERAARHADEGYRHSESCDDIAARIRSGEPAVSDAPDHTDGDRK